MTSGSRTRSKPALDRVLRTADRLFYERGIQCTGVDTIVEEAGVSKATLYAHFRTKDELVVDYLDRRSASWRVTLMSELDRRGGDPRTRIATVFEVLGEWFGSEEYRGCPFINAEAEYGENNPARDVTMAHRAWVRGVFRGLALEAGLDNAEGVAVRLSILYDGAMSSAQIEPNIQWAAEAKNAALAVIGAAEVYRRTQS